MDQINPLVWYGVRELNIVPPHFKCSTTETTSENLFWVRTKLSGRFSTNHKHFENIFDLNSYIYFEDEKDLVLFELRWSGSK